MSTMDVPRPLLAHLAQLARERVRLGDSKPAIRLSEEAENRISPDDLPEGAIDLILAIADEIAARAAERALREMLQGSQREREVALAAVQELLCDGRWRTDPILWRLARVIAQPPAQGCGGCVHWMGWRGTDPRLPVCPYADVCRRSRPPFSAPDEDSDYWTPKHELLRHALRVLAEDVAVFSDD